jgi:hypothetical protein
MISFRRNQGIRFCARFLSEFSEFFGRAAAVKVSFFSSGTKRVFAGIRLSVEGFGFTRLAPLMALFWWIDDSSCIFLREWIIMEEIHSI